MASVMSILRPPALFLLASALAGCGSDRDATPNGGAVDPATRLALEAPLLVDPALESQSRRFAVMTDPAPLDGSLPLDIFAPATAAAARSEAKRLSGSSDAAKLGGGGGLDEVPCAACSAPALTLRVAAVGKKCGGPLVAALELGARMPAALPIYPGAHLREAGSSQGACPVRVASFTAPAHPTEALGFYRALATKSGFSLSIARSDRMSALLGRRAADGARFAVIARPLVGRRSEIDLVVSGF